MKNKNLKIIFMGTPEFGAIILKELVKANKPSLVVTAPDKPVGRNKTLASPPVKVVAKENEIDVLQSDNPKEITKELCDSSPDLIIVAAYGYIIPKEILNIPKYGCLNVHPSLLPKYRGPSPVHWAILNGDKKTGVTIMALREKLDAGPVISQTETEMKEKETQKELNERLAVLGAELLIKTIPQWVEGKIKPKEQKESEVSWSEIIKKDYGRIDWTEPAEKIERKVRAFVPWPGTYTLWEDRKIKVIRSRVLKNPDGITYPVGKVLVVPQNEIGVQCGDKDFLVIEILQLEGKKETKAEDFLRGHSDFIGTILK